MEVRIMPNVNGQYDRPIYRPSHSAHPIRPLEQPSEPPKFVGRLIAHVLKQERETAPTWLRAIGSRGAAGVEIPAQEPPLYWEFRESGNSAVMADNLHSLHI